MNIKQKIWKIFLLIIGLFNPVGVKIICFSLIWVCAYETIGKFIPPKYGYISSISYFSLALLEIIREHCFGIKWYARKYPKTIECPNCHAKVHLENPEYGRGVLTLPPAYGYGWYDLKAFFFRPHLHLHCPNCGLDQIVCPHCDKPITEEDERCPHCGKRIVSNRPRLI